MSSPNVPDFLRPDTKPGSEVVTRRPGIVGNVIGVLEGGNSRWLQSTEWFRSHFSFWPFVLSVAVLSAVYFYVIAEPLYVSQSVISLRSKSQSVGGGLGSFLTGITGGDSTTNQNAALVDHIQSYEMLAKLDKQLHVRALWTSSSINYFERLSPNASSEDFRSYYLSMITVTLQPDTGLIEVDVSGFTPKDAARVNALIVAESERFMNAISASIQRATIKFAENELKAASVAVATAQPFEQAYAETRLNAAQQGLAAAAGVASQQQIFVVRVSGPNFPTEATLPRSFLNTLGLTIMAAVLYVIGYLLWSNVVDHRRV